MLGCGVWSWVSGVVASSLELGFGNAAYVMGCVCAVEATLDRVDLLWYLFWCAER